MSDRLFPLKEAALDTPHAPALIAESIFSFAQLDRETDRMVAYLRSQNLKPRDTLALQLPPGLHFLTLLFATLRIGAAFCPLNLRLPASQIATQLKQINPKLFIDLTGCHSYPNSSQTAADLLLFTSGSTGIPKCAHLTLNNLLVNAQGLLKTVDLSAGDCWLLSLPLYHVGGLGILFRCLLARASFSLTPHAPITHLSYVPTQLYRSWPIYPRLKTILLGGAPLGPIPPELPIVGTYGLTEMASAVLAKKNPTRFLGFPLPGREVKLEQGEIFVRGPCLFLGYGTERTEDWFATGDLGAFDPVEGFAITGRKDNLFISGGENIQPEEIEQHLAEHPKIIEAIVIPQLDREFGARPVVFTRSSISLDEIREFLSERLPKYKIPIAHFSLDETTENGLKISRKKLFEQLNGESNFSHLKFLISK